MKLVLTCEHGGNDIPETYKKHFKNKAVLKTHRGYDLGALDLFQNLEPLSNVSYFSTTSRLLIELNRSLHHNQLFSEFTKIASKTEKSEIIETYYFPYRSLVEKNIKNYIDNGDVVLHLSIHSFTSQLNNKTRNCDIGLLFDSTKKPEQAFCKKLKTELLKEGSNLNVRFNYPYLGKNDGFTTYLRTKFTKHYLGIEIEMNQKFVSKNIADLKIKMIIYKAMNSIQF
ncbi:N-formylglutamate amidohydrolase [Lacinutrix sp. Bg11-31]|uniref:N-formylglutamate amidohydrolase n=1 Tax=Lacinutrix sp. Bg11-31 TaxID=2057808 RepID=UPI000C31051B|nr:N-formylglutamate amidohydrolase [Lacinutrix sp. Bg11-31]AUC80662.1 N-formylglutamate amidohydrolase [Lacinutrix sp. Bg11-31]